MSNSVLPRCLAQLAFVLLCLWIGVEFHLFVRWGLGLGPYHPRPAGVDGFLPIGALMSLKLWMNSGVINPFHPAGIFILLAVISTSLLVKKSFCSWLCPIGTLSEALWLTGKRLFGANLALPRWIDWPLRSLKYLLLFFFLQAIWRMGESGLAHFLHSPYYRMADVKMYFFFAELSALAFWVIVGLALLSMIVKNFWCRYLCSYGALLGVVGFHSLVRLTRTPRTCVDCRLCTQACPAHIQVHDAMRVRSDECTTCLSCVAACPVPGTLAPRLTSKGRPLSAWALLLLIATLFMALTGAARLFGHWHNRISPLEYQQRFQNLHAPVYDHSRGRIPDYGPED